MLFFISRWNGSCIPEGPLALKSTMLIDAIMIGNVTGTAWNSMDQSYGTIVPYYGLQFPLSMIESTSTEYILLW